MPFQFHHKSLKEAQAHHKKQEKKIIFQCIHRTTDDLQGFFFF